MNIFLTIITVVSFIAVLLFAGFYAIFFIETFKEDYMEDYGNHDEEN
jgi:hypothetical protein